MVSAERGQVTGDDESKQNQKRLTPFPETLARRTPSRSLPGVGVVDVNVGSGGGSDDDDGGDDVNGGGNNSLDGFPVPNSSGDKTRKLSAGPLIPETCTWSWSCIRSCTPIMALDTSPSLPTPELLFDVVVAVVVDDDDEAPPDIHPLPFPIHHSPPRHRSLS